MLETVIQQKLDQITPPSETKLWLKTALFSGFGFLLASLYLFARRGDYDLFIANKAFATTSLMLIGLSLALSGICYFWNFADRQIIYRKQLGLSGFAFGITHIIISAFFLPNKFPYPEWFNQHWISVLFGAIAFLIFAIMALVSNKAAVIRLGPLYWKTILRTGYVGFIFVIIHFALLKYPEWIKWFSTIDPVLPPLSLLEFIFSVLVLGLRIAVWFDAKRKSMESKIAANKNPL